MKFYTRLIKHYAAGEMILAENGACDGMYIIDSGRVRVFKTVGDGANRKEVDLCTLGAKAMFGEMALIAQCERSASVQAVEPTSCTIISRQIFEDQLSRIPVWMLSMIRVLVSRLRETNEKLRQAAQSNTPLPPETHFTEMLTFSEKTGEPFQADSEKIIQYLFEKSPDCGSKADNI